MVDEEKFKKAVVRALGIQLSDYKQNLVLGEIPEWDSLAHLSLIFALEDAFGIKFESEQIPKMINLDLLREHLNRAE